MRDRYSLRVARSSRNARRTWREKRIAHLVEQIESGTYSVPAIDVAHAILHGRPKWGDDPKIADPGEVPLLGLDLTTESVDSKR